MWATLPGREAQVAEDDVLDALLEERLAARPDLGRLLAEQVEDDREVVDAEAPERVLVAPDRAEVLAVAVDVEDVAELARVDELLELRDARVVEEQVAGHQRRGPAPARRARRAPRPRPPSAPSASRRRRAFRPASARARELVVRR